MIEKLKQLAGDTVVYGISIFFGRFLTFLLTPFYTNNIPQDDLGIIFVFFTAFAFLNIFYSFGFDGGFFRFSSDKSTSEEKKTIFTMSFLTIAILASASTLLIIIFRHQIASLFPEIDNGADWVLLGSLIPLIDSLMFIPFSRLRLVRKTVRFGITRLAIVILTVILNIWFVTELEMGGKGVLIAGVISPFMIGLTFIPDIVRNLTSRIDKKLWKDILRFSAPTVPASLAVIALQFIDQPLLMAIKGPAANAIYAANYKLALPMMMFVSMFEYAWKPFYLSHFNDKNAKDMFRTVLTYYVAFCGLIFLIVAGFIPYIAKMQIGDSNFYDASYWGGLYIIPIIMGGYFFNGLFNQFSMGVNITKTTKYLPIAVGTAASVNLIGNTLLIPEYGMDASAWLTIVSYGVAALVIYRFSQKVYPIAYQWKKIALAIFFSLTLFIVADYIKTAIPDNYRILIDIGALLAYPICLYITGFFGSRELAYIRRIFTKK